MNPMTRKMFKSRDARTKLRGMGGILASSPELAQTVQQFQDGGNVDAGFGSNVEYTYSKFLAENNLNDTPQAREMFARYKSLMDTRDPLTDPQLFSSVGFDRAPPRLGGAGIQFDMYQDTVRGSKMGDDRPSSSRFENPYYSLGKPLVSGMRRMGYGDTRSIGPQRPEGTDVAFTRQTSPAAPAAPQSTLDQLRSSVYSTGPLEAFGQAYGQQAEVFAPSSKAREDEKAFRAVGESFDNNALLSSGRAPSVLDELRGNVYSTGPLEATLAAVGPSLNEAFSREGMPSQTAADIANETALRNREMASENAGRLAAEELMSSGPAKPGAAPELTAEELAMQAYGQSLGEQNAPIGENAEQVDQAVSEFFEFLGSPKVGSGAVNFPGAEGRAIMRGDLTAAEMMPPLLPPLTDLPAEERRMDYAVPIIGAEGETPVVEAPAAGTATETPAAEAPAAGAATETPAADTSPATDTAAPVVTEEVVKKVADPKIQKKAAELAPSPDDTEDDLRTKYEARAKLFREILGEDEAGARNKGMDLAMIGLAIMSGQSPNALTNIAQGGAAGLKAMSARDEAARERQRLVRTTALESVLEEEAATKAATATAAEKAADRKNRLDAARISAAGRSSLYADDDRTYEVAAEAARARASDPLFPPDDFLEGDTIESYSKRAGDAAVRYKNESRAAGLGSSAVPIGTQIQNRVNAAKDNPAALAAIKQSLISKGIDPSTYGIK